MRRKSGIPSYLLENNGCGGARLLGHLSISPDGPYDEGFLERTMRAWPHRHGTIGFFYVLIEKKNLKL
ncbi:hypothetical protein DRN43_07240 [Thermococci archaeon]|nr:MAG: hypothetical protein DRN43_07240 [Thermococci archaeon]